MGAKIAKSQAPGARVLEKQKGNRRGLNTKILKVSSRGTWGPVLLPRRYPPWWTFSSIPGVSHLAPYNPHSLGLSCCSHPSDWVCVCGEWGVLGAQHPCGTSGWRCSFIDTTRCYSLISPQILGVRASASFSFLSTHIRLWHRRHRRRRAKAVWSEHAAMMTSY